MSSTALEDSLTQVLPLTIGTPEHEAYYYDKLEKAMYSSMNETIELCPEITMCRIWISLGDAGQRAIIDKIKGICKYGHCRFNIEDQENVDQIVSTLLGCILADMPDPEEEEQEKDRLKEGKNFLIDARDQQKKGNLKNRKKKAEGNRLLKTAITRSHVQKAQESSNSSDPLQPASEELS